MSNIFPKGTVTFYPVPQCLISSGKLTKMSEGAHKLYQALLYKAQMHSKSSLELTNKDIKMLVGLSPNSIRRGRTELWEAQLVDLKHVPGGRYSYVILNPLTGAPISQSYAPSERGSTPNGRTTPNAKPLPWQDIGRPS